MKRKKTLLMALALVSICLVSVAGTLAYLTATSKELKNTFASSTLISAENFTLDEHEVEKEEGKQTYKFKTTTTDVGNSYEVTPGVNLPKDPTVHVKDLKQEAYLFIEVTDSLKTGISWEMDENWEAVAETPNVYVYKTKLAAGTTADYNVMKQDAGNSLKVATTFAADEQSAGDLSFKAYLIQAAGFTTIKDAWTAAKSGN